MTSLQDKFQSYIAAMAAWAATEKDGNLDTDNNEFEALMQAEEELIATPCTTHEDVAKKIHMVLSNHDLEATVRDDWSTQGVRYFGVFLQSLQPVDKSKSGEN